MSITLSFQDFPSQYRMEYSNYVKKPLYVLITFFFYFLPFKMFIKGIFLPHRFLDEVQSYSGINKMSVQNLATVFGPNILRPKVEDPLTIMEGELTVNNFNEKERIYLGLLTVCTNPCDMYIKFFVCFKDTELFSVDGQLG